MKEKLKQFQQGFRLGIGIMLAFIVPSIIIALKPEWNKDLILAIFLLPTVFWLACRASQEQEEEKT